jgi:hypothetical protein
MWSREALLDALTEGEKSGIEETSPREVFDAFLKAHT